MPLSLLGIAGRNFSGTGVATPSDRSSFGTGVELDSHTHSSDNTRGVNSWRKRKRSSSSLLTVLADSPVRAMSHLTSVNSRLLISRALPFFTASRHIKKLRAALPENFDSSTLQVLVGAPVESNSCVYPFFASYTRLRRNRHRLFDRSGAPYRDEFPTFLNVLFDVWFVRSVVKRKRDFQAELTAVFAIGGGFDQVSQGNTFHTSTDIVRIVISGIENLLSKREYFGHATRAEFLTFVYRKYAKPLHAVMSGGNAGSISWQVNSPTARPYELNDDDYHRNTNGTANKEIHSSRGNTEDMRRHQSPFLHMSDSSFDELFELSHENPISMDKYFQARKANRVKVKGKSKLLVHPDSPIPYSEATSKLALDKTGSQDVLRKSVDLMEDVASIVSLMSNFHISAFSFDRVQPQIFNGELTGKNQIKTSAKQSENDEVTEVTVDAQCGINWAREVFRTGTNKILIRHNDEPRVDLMALRKISFAAKRRKNVRFLRSMMGHGASVVKSGAMDKKRLTNGNSRAETNKLVYIIDDDDDNNCNLENDSRYLCNKNAEAAVSVSTGAETETSAILIESDSSSVSSLSDGERETVSDVESDEVEDDDLEQSDIVDTGRLDSPLGRITSVIHADSEASNFVRSGRLITPLSARWNRRVEAVLKIDCYERKVTYFKHDFITRKDIATIWPQGSEDGNGWLNDEVINQIFGYMVDALLQRYAQDPNAEAEEGFNNTGGALDTILSTLTESDVNSQAACTGGAGTDIAPACMISESSNSTPKAHAFSSFWFTQIRNKGVESVRRWSRRARIENENLLNVNHLFIPVNNCFHWTLLYISPRRRLVEYYDSLSSGNRGNGAFSSKSSIFFMVARDYLESNLQCRYREEEWKYTFGKSGQQSNGVDCGVFAVWNAIAIAKGLEPYLVVTDADMPRARRLLIAILLNGGFKDDFALWDFGNRETKAGASKS